MLTEYVQITKVTLEKFVMILSLLHEFERSIVDLRWEGSYDWNFLGNTRLDFKLFSVPRLFSN